MEDHGGVAWDGQVKAYGLWYLSKNHWRIAAMCDREDIPSEAFRVFWEIRQQHPEITDPKQFMKFYRVKLHFFLITKSRGCFPNPYNLSTDPSGSCVSLTDMETGSNLLERLTSATSNAASDVEDCLDLLSKIPDELQEVCAALFREALGLVKLPSIVRRKLRGRPVVESINSTLCRLFNLDKRRDLLEEIGRLYLETQGGAMSVESEVLEATQLKRKAKETDQAFLKRIVETIDEWDDEDYNELSNGARHWHDRAVLAVQEGDDIPPLSDGAEAKKGAKAMPVDDDDEDLEAAGPEDEDDDDEDLTEEDEEETEEEPEEEVKTKTKPGRKARASATSGKKAAPKEKAAKTDGAKRGRERQITDDMRIVVKQEQSGYREGSKRARLFDLYKSSETVGKFRKAAVKQGIVDEGREMAFLRLHAKEGLIAFEK